ncbi:thymidylate synthase/dCMP hydroxymethylase domain-containing protein [Microdochium trichocladiopsis]|uniref:Thymidylate synthase n=1 Tax=Microdochium trichocladiopsis TaxID=1682393 RepID=A0A9P9BT70_9PEZI|nr:thymidylate synthase/dCMP hydroxymethylase domain-containing protein [Microdochium trichocladiopsis]KAH7035640.1 thymidylate synthase/dCMP hydroxymethylase domain-containing protein [Microdochium trichocladiopsis]
MHPIKLGDASFDHRRVSLQQKCVSSFSPFRYLRRKYTEHRTKALRKDTKMTASTDPSGSAAPPAETKTAQNGSVRAKRHEEYQYLDLVQEILDNGEHRPDRTGTGTFSIFALTPMKFALNDEGKPILPLLTTKRVFLKAVIAELLWFVEGCTSSIPLSDAGVKIWDGNGSREFLDSVGLSHREVGDLGPVYGFQWRHFGAEYVDAKTDYTGQGVDQLAEVVHKLKTNPYDRRIIMSAWNPADLKKMALPPCHMFAQFYVSYPRSRSNNNNTGAASEDGETQRPQGHLHCQLYQRSCDMGLGVPFNIASYALLTHMIAHVCDLVPGSLTHVMGDAHVYCDHVDALKVQVEREPREFPALEIKREKGGSIDGWKYEDFVVHGYNPHKTIAMKMSV